MAWGRRVCRFPRLQMTKSPFFKSPFFTCWACLVFSLPPITQNTAEDIPSWASLPFAKTRGNALLQKVPSPGTASRGVGGSRARHQGGHPRVPGEGQASSAPGRCTQGRCRQTEQPCPSEPAEGKGQQRSTVQVTGRHGHQSVTVDSGHAAVDSGLGFSVSTAQGAWSQERHNSL